MPAGCGGTGRPEENPTADHLRKIGQAFDLAIDKNRRPPRNTEELRPFLKPLTQQDDPDAFLRSPNDGLPYMIVFGVHIDKEDDSAALFAHEQKGAGGKRYVITVARIVKEMTDADFSRATYAGGKKPTAAK